MPGIQQRRFLKIQRLMQYLMGRAAEPCIAWRGQADASFDLKPSLTRGLIGAGSYETKLSIERSLIAHFEKDAVQFLPTAASNVLVDWYREPLAAMTVMQHYGAPTRLLDWTASPWIALYFAAIHKPECDGAVWAFNYYTLGRAMGHVFNRRGIRAEPGGYVDLTKLSFGVPASQWIVPMFNVIPFSRVEIQQGFFTVAGDLEADHSELLSDWLEWDECSDWEGLSYLRAQHFSPLVKVIIPARLKYEAINILHGMNIRAASIDFPFADHIGRSLSGALKTAGLDLHGKKSGLQSKDPNLLDLALLMNMERTAKSYRQRVAEFAPKSPRASGEPVWRK